MKIRLPWVRTKRLALAESETLKALTILAMQQRQIEEKLDEVIEALNAFSAIVGLEWKTEEKRWMKLQ